MIPRRTSDTRINLSSNELSHPRLAPILIRAVARLRGEDFRRYPNLVDAVAVIATHLGLAPQELLLTPGSDAALRLICRHYLRSRPAGGRLLLQHPNYYAWEQSAALLNLEIERVRWSDISTPGRELIAAANRRRGALIGVSVPNGPVGGCLSSSELDELIDTVRRRGHLLTIDGCYQAFNGPWTEQLRRRGEQILVVQSLSKSHGLAGARVGVVAGHPELVEQLAESRLEHAVSWAALAMASAVLESTDDFEAIWDDIRASREAAAAKLRRAGLEVLPSGGNFLSFRVGTPTRAAAAARGMSDRGYRVKHLADDAGFSDCLRMTIQDRPATQEALDDLLDVIASITTRSSDGCGPLVAGGD